MINSPCSSRLANCHVGITPLTPTVFIWGTVALRVERQSARMSKITNGDLTLAVTIWQQWASKG